MLELNNSCWPILYGRPDTIPCRRIFPASHSSDAQRFFSDPVSIGQFPSFNTHSSPDNPNPLSRASNRNQSLNSPAFASLILHDGVHFLHACPHSTEAGEHPLSPDTHGSSCFRCSENPCRPHFYRPASRLNTHCGPCTPNPLPDTSNRILSVGSPLSLR